MNKNKKTRYLTQQQESEILAAGMNPKDLPAFRKGKPFILTGTCTTFRLVDGKLFKTTYQNKRQQASDIARLREQGIPLTKLCLKLLRDCGYELSSQEMHRIALMK